MSRLWSPVTRWADFRRRQLAALEQSNRIAAQAQDDGALDALTAPGWTTPPRMPAAGRRGAGGGAAAPAAVSVSPRPPVVVPAADAPLGHNPTYGVVGRPLNRHSPFYIGFFGATGPCWRSACGSWSAGSRTTLTLLIVSMFLALALNPIVDALVDRGVRRAGSVAVVFTGLLVAFVLIGFLVIPPVVVQGTELAQQTPELHRGPPGQQLGARARQELRRHRQGARRGAGADDRPAVPRGRARRHPRRRAGRAQRRLPGLHRAGADPVLPVLAPAGQARGVRDGAGHPPAPGRVAVRGDHAAHRVLRHRPGRHRDAERAAVLRDDDASSASPTPRCWP